VVRYPHFLVRFNQIDCLLLSLPSLSPNKAQESHTTKQQLPNIHASFETLNMEFSLYPQQEQILNAVVLRPVGQCFLPAGLLQLPPHFLPKSNIELFHS
jgi:hypothetical protein